VNPVVTLDSQRFMSADFMKNMSSDKAIPYKLVTEV